MNIELTSLAYLTDEELAELRTTFLDMRDAWTRKAQPRQVHPRAAPPVGASPLSFSGGRHAADSLSSVPLPASRAACHRVTQPSRSVPGPPIWPHMPHMGSMPWCFNLRPPAGTLSYAC